MPSSSTRNTHLERTLVLYFRQVWTYLHASNLSAQAWHLATPFAVTLDMDPDATERTLQPTYNDAMPEPQRSEALEAVQVMRALWRDCQAMEVGRRCWEAGEACVAMGALLMRYKRAAQGQQWCSWGEELGRMAERHESMTERAKKARNEGDVIVID